MGRNTVTKWENNCPECHNVFTAIDKKHSVPFLVNIHGTTLGILSKDAGWYLPPSEETPSELSSFEVPK